ncbi:unnamed protein product [Candidula unifasciata]|uniref:CUB domain-containing protein n=1 Tax=Candidula unifasciata TaxID=100452 RepID=A0A8S3Z201_9EUPU|nr:unnamed protein product [Candidula unifasciata]
MSVNRQNFTLLLAILGTLTVGSVTAQNFAAYTLNPVPIIVNLDATSPAIILQSPNFGIANYENLSNYTLTIRSGSVPLVLVFSFRHFNLEYEQSCLYDALYLREDAFCGTWAAGREFPYLFLPQREFTIRFKTDESVRRPGFQILVDPEPADNVYDDYNGDYPNYLFSN